MDRGPPRVKNKAPAPLQISAEQILLEAFERKEEPLKVPKQRIADLEELQEFQGRKRKEYEDALRRNRLNIGQWLRYANWELEQKEYARARSVFERALDVDPTNVPLWVRYSESEMKNRNINHARNVLDRAVTTLPRVDKLWYAYVGMEETLGNIEGCRQVFERWMKWEPSTQAWQAYINMEKRYHEYDRARRIFERFTAVHPESENWIKWARFEDEVASPENVRDVYSLAVDTLNEAGPEFLDEGILGYWALWEARQKEWERAKAIYKFGLDNLARNKSRWLYDQYSKFEKQYGDKEGIQNVILAKRRVLYEDQVKENPRNYDAWFSYLSLMEESSDDPELIRDVFERAIANVPPSKEKRHWRRYIYLWIKYAVWEELEMKNIDRAKQVYEECIKLIPHKQFTFAKVWILYAKYELRRGNLTGFRKILGTAIGMCPKPRLFKGYIDLEVKLKEFDRCRKLYEKFLELFPSSPQPWIEYGDLEQILGDQERARAILELAISQNDMEMPELLWKRYIEFETEEGEFSRARNLYERLLDKTNHVKVWLSYALFEVSAPDNEDEYDEEEEEEEGGGERQPSDEAKERARKVFERAWKSFKERGLNEERVILLNGWKQFELVHGTSQDIDKVEKMKPRMVKKRRKLQDGSFQEYMDYIFPTDEDSNKTSNVKFLQAAQEWKRKQLEMEKNKAAAAASENENENNASS